MEIVSLRFFLIAVTACMNRASSKIRRKTFPLRPVVATQLSHSPQPVRAEMESNSNVDLPLLPTGRVPDVEEGVLTSNGIEILGSKHGLVQNGVPIVEKIGDNVSPVQGRNSQATTPLASYFTSVKGPPFRIAAQQEAGRPPSAPRRLGSFAAAAWRGARHHPWPRKRVLSLLFFFGLSLSLPVVDIVTDVIGGLSLLSRGHVYWAAVTFSLTLAPSIAVVAVAMAAAFTRFFVLFFYLCAVLFSGFSVRRSCGGFGWKEVKLALQHLPFVQPVM